MKSIVRVMLALRAAVVAATAAAMWFLYSAPARADGAFAIASMPALSDRVAVCRKVIFTDRDGDTVPALLVSPRSASAAGPAPCLLLIHWLGGQKEQLIPVARLEAQDGYASLIMDLPGFGERKRAQASFADVGAMTAYLNRFAEESVADERAELDFLATRPDIDSSRIGIVGVSLGSMVGVDVAAADLRVRAVMLIAGGGGLGELLTNQAEQRLPGSDRIARAVLASTPAQLNLALAAIDPVNLVGKIAPRPLLMENGAKDTIVPPSSARMLYDAAREPKHIDWYEGAGHIPSPLGLYASLSVFLHENLPLRIARR